MLPSSPILAPVSRLRALALPAIVVATLSACAEPPTRELEAARRALATAHAAGAPDYAAAAYKGAAGALAKAEQAAAAGDYRLALSHALDAREQAEAAARQAGEERARLRREAEQVLAQAAPLVERLDTLLTLAQRRRLSARFFASIRAARSTSAQHLEQARAALGVGQERTAHTLARDLVVRLEQSVATLEAALRARPPRRRRG